MRFLLTGLVTMVTILHTAASEPLKRTDPVVVRAVIDGDTIDVSNYGRVRWDWWVMIWWKDAPDTETLGVILLLVFLAGTGGGAFWWVRLHRRDVL